MSIPHTQLILFHFIIDPLLLKTPLDALTLNVSSSCIFVSDERVACPPCRYLQFKLYSLPSIPIRYGTTHYDSF